MKEYPSRSCLSINWAYSFPFFFFFLSTAWFLISSFDQTLSSTVGWYINKFTWWFLRSRNPVLREQDMWGAELGICLYCFSCLKDLSWDHFSYMFFFFFFFFFKLEHLHLFIFFFGLFNISDFIYLFLKFYFIF